MREKRHYGVERDYGVEVKKKSPSRGSIFAYAVVAGLPDFTVSAPSVAGEVQGRRGGDKE
jgi:hypothetical protein